MAQNDLVVAMTGASGSVYGLRLLEVLLKAGRVVHFSFSPAAAQVLEREVDRKIDPENFTLSDLFGSEATSLTLSTRLCGGRGQGEGGDGSTQSGALHYHHYRDFSAGIASGSFLTAGMAVCPCSMGTVAAIAHGTSDNLIHRAADVHLKERRKLVLVPRETPLGLVQLRNLATCAEAGATVLPAMPGFYHRPTSINQMVDFIVGRVCDQLGVEHRLFERWGVAEKDEG